MRLCSIASGSSGNCIYIGSEKTHLLVDTGISGKRTEAGLNVLGVSLRDIDGILLTHEHTDHIGGLGVISRKYGIPIYSSKKTIQAIKKADKIGTIEEDLFCPIQVDDRIVIKDIMVCPMQVSHDAADPFAYRFACDEKKIGVITDLGMYDDDTVQSLQGMDALLLEANHDINMLQIGAYPYYLKQRILGDRGHLSNERSGRLLSRLLHDKMQHIVLGHLSHENNMAELAYETVRLEVSMADTPYTGNDFPITVAKRNEVSAVIQV
ncbi:MAG: MBL fold metallo-hydrolase [Lachnospiraceae bacterium]